MKLSKIQKWKANELLKAVQGASGEDQLRKRANQIIPNDQEAISILNGFMDILEKTLENDRVDNEEFRKSLIGTIDALRSILKDGKITTDERSKILDIICELHKYQAETRKIEMLKTGIIATAALTALAAMSFIILKGRNRA